MQSPSLLQSLRREILTARQRIYEIGRPTPLDTIHLKDPECTVFAKREDLSEIHAYKWRGAYNCMAKLSEAQLKNGVVTASAGNHAQGVALAAAKLNTQATIFMPLSTPRMKQLAVKKYGGPHVAIKLFGDTYDAASNAAHSFANDQNRAYIHAYDDLFVMAGQGTLADEIVLSGKGPFDYAFLQVGGGGMAAATATWLKLNYPDIHIIGVEGVNQASMAAAIKSGKPSPLSHVDIFCDGTAVKQVGQLTYQVCTEVVDQWVTVSNDEVSAAIQFLWEELRCIPEPSGAMGVAAILRMRKKLMGKKVLSIICGANMDFELLATIARRSAIGASRRRYLRIKIEETPGSMFKLLEALPNTVNIADFQYGKTSNNKATPVIGFDHSPIEFDALRQALHQHNYAFTEVSSEPDVTFRFIHFEARLIKHPLFITLDFHERAGALSEFLRVVSHHSNLCYFNYVYSGERVGRALLGFEFNNQTEYEVFKSVLNRAENAYRSYTVVPEESLQRIMG